MAVLASAEWHAVLGYAQQIRTVYEAALREEQDAWQKQCLAENEALSVLEEGDGIPETIARNQELEILTEAIQSLPDRCRQIFTLRKVYGLSQREIATRLGVSENTVSAQLTIGVRKCMDFMQRCRREREGFSS